VIVECFHPGYRTIAFLTGSVRDASGWLFYKIFIPTALNPTSGFLMMLPEEKVYISSMDVQAALQMIVSGGMLSPETMDIPPADPAPSAAGPELAPP
jgi:uncharacterized membrane protein